MSKLQKVSEKPTLPVHVTREEYAAMTTKERKKYYWHDGRLCLRKIHR